MANQNRNIEKFITEILEQCAKFMNLSNYETHLNIDWKKGDGFFSDFFKTTISNKDNGENFSIGIKITPGETSESEYGALFTYEVHFYSKIFPKLDALQKQKCVEEPFNNIPKFLAGSDRPGQEFVAMEDLITSGFKLYDKKKYLDNKHLELIFKTYGKFHALSFVFKEKYPDCYNNLMEKIADPMKTFPNFDKSFKSLQASVLAGIDSLDPKTDVEQLEKFKKCNNPGNILFGTYNGDYACLRHGDCWSNNMMFKYKEDTGEPIDVKLLDFQVICPGTPVHDLSYFFYTGASKADMDKLDYYLELYHKSFSKFARELGGDPDVLFPMGVLKKEWKEYGAYGINLGFHMWLIKLIDKDELSEVLDDLPVEQFYNFWEKRLKEVRKGSDFKERARNLCYHAVEYGLV